MENPSKSISLEESSIGKINENTNEKSVEIEFPPIEEEVVIQKRSSSRGLLLGALFIIICGSLGLIFI